MEAAIPEKVSRTANNTKEKAAFLIIIKTGRDEIGRMGNFPTSRTNSLHAFSVSKNENAKKLRQIVLTICLSIILKDAGTRSVLAFYKVGNLDAHSSLHEVTMNMPPPDKDLS